MKKTNRLVGLFASSMIVAPVAGCSDAPDEVEICYDLDYDMRCDDDGDLVMPGNYLVIDGKKTRIFIDDDNFYQGGFGGDDDGFGG